MINILITGVGAIIGYGIVRSLQHNDNDCYIVGSDIYCDAVGQKWADKFIVAPLTSEAKYLQWLQTVIIENNINLVIPGIEQDLYFFSENRSFFETHSVCVVLNNKKLIDLSRDKWLMYQELTSINSSFVIPSFNKGTFNDLSILLGLPFIMKPRCGYASKGLIRVNNENDFIGVAPKLGEQYIAQPFVGHDDQEYTVSIFGDGKGNVRILPSITLRRKLSSDGSTVKAWVSQYDSLDYTIQELCRHFKPIGPTNFQFRKIWEEWKLLEINPRISSSTSLRTAFGYNEAQMCVDFYIHDKIIIQPVIQKGRAVRYIEDYVTYDRNHL